MNGGNTGDRGFKMTEKVMTFPPAPPYQFGLKNRGIADILGTLRKWEILVMSLSRSNEVVEEAEPRLLRVVAVFVRTRLGLLLQL